MAQLKWAFYHISVVAVDSLFRNGNSNMDFVHILMLSINFLVTEIQLLRRKKHKKVFSSFF